jgi:hypothetical protein
MKKEGRAAAKAVLLLTGFSSLACGADPGEHGAGYEAEPAAEVAANLAPASVSVRLVPRSGVSGLQRVNFAVPAPKGLVASAANVRVLKGGVEIPSARRGLAKFSDGTFRSVQVQVDVSLSGQTTLDVRLGEAGTAASLSLASVESTLSPADGTQGPRVWALLPASWLSSLAVMGSQVPEADVSGAYDAWERVCDYTRFNTDAFLSLQSDPAVWLYDRGAAMYRGYARRGDLTTLSSAYRETSIYRNGITGTGTSTRIGVPGKSGDLKYHYAENMAVHYLLTGDDRFREAAENVATRAAQLWSDPGYAGGADFWTERNAGFALLAYVWAMVVSDDKQAEFRSRADTAFNATVSVQNTYPIGYTDPNARCFAHHADAHGEPYGYFGCSPWMSAILVDALDAYATYRGGTERTLAHQAIVELGRILAREGRDATGRPFYWMGVNNPSNEADSYNEHWGESAYIVAMAWHHSGRTDATLRTAADQLVAGFNSKGVAPHMRSFNWQCRSAVATPFFLR